MAVSALARRRLAYAQNLDKLPNTDQALAGGHIGYHHAALIARTAQREGCERVGKEEPNLIKAAKELDPGRFAAVTQHLRHSVDPAGALAEANHAYNRRYFDVKRSYDGHYVLDGLLDPEGGAALQAAINALSPRSRTDRRFAWQRRADALVELARRQLDGGGLPEVGGQRPHLTVTTTLETLQAMPGQPAGDLQWALPVPAQTVRRLACDAAATTAVLDHDGLPMGVGRTARTIPPALRRALVVRDRGCRFPSCDRPSDWTDGHHLKHWADGGETSLNNLLLLCRRHHRKVHEEGWRLAWGEDGRVLAIPPPWMQARPDPLRLPAVTAIGDG